MDNYIRKRKINFERGKNMCALTQVKEGQSCRIKSLSGDKRFISRVTSVGLTLGCVVEMIQNKGKYPLLVYTRDSTVAGADKIIVLDNGELVQQGTHDELMLHDGLYRKLFTIQQESLSLKPTKFHSP